MQLLIMQQNQRL